MFSRHRWHPITVGFLIAVTTLGSWGCRSVPCCEDAAAVVLVSAMDAVSNDLIVISKKRRQEILWRLPADSTIQSVAISLAGKPAPFEACATAEGTCRIPCERRVCSSGPINPSLEPPAGGITYAYLFQRPEGASADPTIRIDP
ncbi:MAG TPA: hypothetical protein VFF17_01865 [Thermoanaerobaculia bacterium]|nr:hypothetical protein [Thermoanaerobaculia bacterium]